METKNIDLKIVTHKLRFWKIVSALLTLALVLSVMDLVDRLGTDGIEHKDGAEIDKSAPYAREVEDIIEHLRYDGLERLKNPAVFISLDFENSLWKLHNLHSFDPEGRIILTKQYYGICGELGQYTFEKIKPFFSKDYKIEFVRVAQSGYFLGPKASHLALRIIEKKSLFSRMYILDPSFHRYGRITSFKDYFFDEILENIPGMKERSPDELFYVGTAAPLIIRRNCLLQLEVSKNYEKFDKNNFLVALVVAQRYNYSGRYVFFICQNAGKKEVFENDRLVQGVLSHEEYEELKKIITRLFEGIIQQTQET